MNAFELLRRLIEIDSPTGFTEDACKFVAGHLEELGWKPQFTNKGAVRCDLGVEPTLSIAAHVDTLGAIVSKVSEDGSLRISPLGGLSLNMAEGEYVRVYPMDGEVVTGTLLVDNPSVHANANHGKAERQTRNMHVRLDAVVRDSDDTRSLGIRPGDFVCFEPRFQDLPSGFLKSRFLDNKAGCIVLLEYARRIAESGRKLPVELFFSNYEEVGHGGTCGYGSEIRELLVIDMGVLGTPCEGSERKCSICAKDSSGPYDYPMRRRLVQLAEEYHIPYVVDVYPFYGSDGSAALRAGNDFRVGLIGPGVAASHGVERTHRQGVEATISLVEAYVDDHVAQKG